MLPRGRQPAALHPPLMWLTEALNDMQIKKIFLYLYYLCYTLLAFEVTDVILKNKF